MQDFDAVKAFGIVGVIHKATEGTAFDDKLYAHRRQAFTDIGMKWGAYHFFHGAQPVLEADHFLSVAQPDADTLVALDWEDVPHLGAPGADKARAFLERIEEKLGRKAVIYSGNVAKEEIAGTDAYFGAAPGSKALPIRRSGLARAAELAAALALAEQRRQLRPRPARLHPRHPRQLRQQHHRRPDDAGRPAGGVGVVMRPLILAAPLLLLAAGTGPAAVARDDMPTAAQDRLLRRRMRSSGLRAFLADHAGPCGPGWIGARRASGAGTLQCGDTAK